VGNLYMILDLGFSVAFRERVRYYTEYYLDLLKRAIFGIFRDS